MSGPVPEELYVGLTSEYLTIGVHGRLTVEVSRRLIGRDPHLWALDYLLPNEHFLTVRQAI